MTEDEMKQTWCPHARCTPAEVTETSATFKAGISFNRYQTAEDSEFIPKGALCLGRACSQWRWSRKDDPPGQPDQGFCGLAGRP